MQAAERSYMTKEKRTVTIHGKEYETVASRVDTFREAYQAYSITTEIISNDNEYVVMKATILDDKSVIRSTGHAQERYGSTTINTTSALENCETSAIGRALASFGLAGTEFASADEVANAIDQQSQGVSYAPNNNSEMSDKQKNWLEKLAHTNDFNDIQHMANQYINRNVVTKKDATDLIDQLKIEGIIEEQV